jgi:hypothetical protein
MSTRKPVCTSWGNVGCLPVRGLGVFNPATVLFLPSYICVENWWGVESTTLTTNEDSARSNEFCLSRNSRNTQELHSDPRAEQIVCSYANQGTSIAGKVMLEAYRAAEILQQNCFD